LTDGLCAQTSSFVVPQKDEQFCVGDIISFSWQHTSEAGLSIEVSFDGGTIWMPIGHNITDTFYIWQTLPDEIASEKYLVRLVTNDYHEVLRSEVFTIGTPARIILQTPDLTVSAGETVRLIARTSGVPKPRIQWYKYDIIYAKWNPIVGATRDTLLILKPTPDDDVSFYKYTAANHCDSVVSDSLRLRVLKKIFVISPNGGEFWRQVCETNQISWYPDSLPGAVFDIFFSETGGTRWHPLVKGVKNSPYQWKSPEDFPKSDSFLISIEARFRTDWTPDTSDAMFTLASPPDKAVLYSHPTDLSVQAGDAARFTVSACAGIAIGYFWDRSDNNGESWVTLFDRGDTLVLPSVSHIDSGALFRARCVTTGGITFSNAARLTVLGKKLEVYNVPQLLIKSVYPNPAKEYIYVDLNISRPVDLSIIDQLGRIIERSHMVESSFYYSIRHLQSGVYYLRISNEDHCQTIRFIVE
jgi:hypothetical protein